MQEEGMEYWSIALTVLCPPSALNTALAGGSTLITVVIIGELSAGDREFTHLSIPLFVRT
jgi:hypothetical protein